MRILTEDIRAAVLTGGDILLHSLGRGVHFRHHIQSIIGCAVKVMSALIVNGACGVYALDKLGTRLEIRPPAALIPERPEYNARAV